MIPIDWMVKMEKEVDNNYPSYSIFLNYVLVNFITRYDPLQVSSVIWCDIKPTNSSISVLHSHLKSKRSKSNTYRNYLIYLLNLIGSYINNNALYMTL